MRHLGIALVILATCPPLIAQATTDSSRRAIAHDTSNLSTARADTSRKTLLGRANDSTYKARLDRFKKLYRTTFIASGAVQTAVGAKSSTTPVSGSLGISHDTPKEHFSALIAVAANGDTLVGKNRRDFATAVLSPGITGIGKGSGVLLDYTRFFGHDICYPPVLLPADPDSSTDPNNKYNSIRARAKPTFTAFSECQAILDAKRNNGLALDNRFGGRAYLSVSKSTWQTATPIDSGGAADDLALVAFGLHFVWIPLNHPLDDKGNGFLFTLEGGFAARGIVGDIADVSEDSLRSGLLGTPGKWFTGVEIQPSLQVNKVTAYGIISWLHNSHHGDDLRGLTGMQVVLGFSFDASVFNF